jgi:hypothetical protein
MADDRVSASKKGSLLYYSKIELRWDATGKLVQDTFITLTNDNNSDVHVKLYLVNGDAPLDPVFVNGVLVERAHRGWNWVDCGFVLTEDESTFFRASSGRGSATSHNSCQPWSTLDPGSPPGRPDLERPGQRVLRGFIVAWAVDAEGNEISWNHLTGHVDIVNYAERSAWEYNSYAFQCLNTTTGDACDTNPGTINMDGTEYDYAFDRLLLDFYAVGSTAMSLGGITVMLDTDLTLHSVSADLRQDDEGPITTKAEFAIWNENEDERSGTTRCITCWDQTLLSNYADANNFLLGVLGTDKGKARIDGVASEECDECFDVLTCDDGTCEFVEVCEIESEDAALLGVAAKILSFSGGVTGTAVAGMTLVGMGTESAYISYDNIFGEPDTASSPNPEVSTPSSLSNVRQTTRTGSPK